MSADKSQKMGQCKGQCFQFCSMLWHCWLGERKSIKSC